MRRKKIVCSLFLVFFVQVSMASSNVDLISELDFSNRRTSFDNDWLFYRGSLADAENPTMDDSRWRKITIPHDWSVEPSPIQKVGITIGPFSKYNEGGAGGIDVGQTLGGEGWYRKSFALSDSDTNKIITLYFEGIYNQSEIYVNGHKVYYNPYGYTSFRVDISRYCRPAGIPNKIAIRVLNVGENSRWYAGSGIYRRVWLIKTPKLHLDEWNTYVDASTSTQKQATIHLSTLICNEKTTDSQYDVLVRIFDPQGKLVHQEQQPTGLDFCSTFLLKHPQRWDLEHPLLYRAEITLYQENIPYDQLEIPFGIRSIEFSAEKGFMLNGKAVLLKGGCIHHDNGLLGAAAIDRAEERKVELMKANGYNAVRCSHNQVSEHFLNTCDRLGLLVIHETFDQWQAAKRKDDYHQFFDEWSDRDLAASVRRDRNHPCIILWSIGNEIAQRADDPEGQDIARRLIQTIHKYDTCRYTTMGANDFWDRPRFTWEKDSYRAFNQLDVAGYNYLWWKYENDVKLFPQRIIYGSESYPKDAALNWNLVEKYPSIVGDFVWTAIDYIGEAGLGHVQYLEKGQHDTQFMGWPWYNAWCGDIDLCGNKKPQSYYRDVVWREREIAMAVRPPLLANKKEVVNAWGWTDEYLSWNWQGKEGLPMRVNVYSRAPRVRLYLNDRVLAEKETNLDNYTATFEVPYQQGVLKAVNLNAKRETASFILQTSGSPSAIRLTADRSEINADKNDLAYVGIEIVDAEGRLVPDAVVRLQLSCQKDGKIVAAGNASPVDMSSFRSLNPLTFQGRALAILQANEALSTDFLPVDSTLDKTIQPETSILFSVKAEGLPQAVLEIKVR